jgi:hypothetical protein
MTGAGVKAAGETDLSSLTATNVAVLPPLFCTTYFSVKKITKIKLLCFLCK